MCTPRYGVRRRATTAARRTAGLADDDRSTRGIDRLRSGKYEHQNRDSLDAIGDVTASTASPEADSLTRSGVNWSDRRLIACRLNRRGDRAGVLLRPKPQ
jgi:hypothetical protein